jgi:beta-glucanase (GH16 family)
MCKRGSSFLIRASVFFALLCYSALALSQTDLNGQWIALNRAGAPNSNLQCFTPRNVVVSGGDLLITTKSEAASCSSFDLPHATYDYTSGFVAMRSFNFLYGTVEFRAKFGGGMKTGAWPTVWMADASCQASDPTGTDDRCNGQEIDIAEILDGDFTHVNQQIHVDDFTHNDGCKPSVTDTSQNFHLYQLAWSPGSLVFRIDGTTTCTITRSYVPNSAMYVKIDMYVGNHGGPMNDNSLPWTTVIDYVKVTQGSVVVFNDGFDLKGTVQPAQPTPPSSYHSTQTLIPRIFSHRPLRVLVICLVIVIAISAFKFCRPRRKTHGAFGKATGGE